MYSLNVWPLITNLYLYTLPIKKICLFWLSMLGDDKVSRVVTKGKSVLVHDVSDEYHENDDGSNDDDSDGLPPGFES